MFDSAQRGLSQRATRHGKPRVALVAHDIHDQGGMERACAELIRRTYHEVDFVVIAANLAPELRALVRRWVRVRIPSRPFPLKFVFFWMRAGLALRRVKADLVHTVGAIVPNCVDVASIHFCHAGLLAADNSFAPKAAPPLRRVNTTTSRTLAVAAERWCYRSSRLRAFAAVSRGVAEEVSRHYATVPVVVTPNGVDGEQFRPDADARTALRATAVVEDGAVALFVGGDWDRKGLGIAVDAVARVRANGHHLYLWVVGGGDDARFSALAQRLEVTPYVRFFGPQRDVAKYYQGSDIFVLPSAYETFSLVCFEAAASGLPLIIPSISGASEVVGANEGGILVERTVDSVAGALAELVARPQLRARLGATARRRASSYTWQHSAESVMALYDKLLTDQDLQR